MLLSAARNNLVCLRRRLLTNKPAIAAPPNPNGKPITSAPTGVDVCVSMATIQDAPHSTNSAMPRAKPAAPAMATSGQLRLSFGRFGAASIASGARKNGKEKLQHLQTGCFNVKRGGGVCLTKVQCNGR
jgi:hypothetical protein